ncbi:MAG: hypothetical protein ABJB40_09655 [Acidobacteriota bacterium]
MSEIFVEWIAVLLFLALLVGVVIGEILWLTKKGWATSGRAAGYVLSTDVLGLGIGSLIVFVIALIMFMMVMGPAGRGGTAPEYAYWITTGIAVIFPPIVLVITKRLFLLMFKVASGSSAWMYSILSSFLILVVVLVPPPIVYFLIAYLSKWK